MVFELPDRDDDGVPLPLEVEELADDAPLAPAESPQQLARAARALSAPC